jgi:aldose 1-epimerase
MRAPTGDQYELTLSAEGHDLTATITQVAAGIRAFRVDGVDVTEPFPVDATPPSGCGIVLVPWPNRVKDGTWDSDGQPRRLALTEPARGNAIHGLLRYRPYIVAEQSAASVTLRADIFPELGYPFQLATSVRYDLTPRGLDVTHTITNAGATPAPVAIGAHPYLKVGGVPTGELTVTVDAATHLDVDDRLNVIGESPVGGTRFDLRGGRRVADLELDDGFADVAMTDGGARHVVSAPDGRTVTLWTDNDFGYVQVYTSRSFPTTTASDVALAVEPMTAPANALNTGRGLRWIEPGGSWSPRWGIHPSGF